MIPVPNPEHVISCLDGISLTGIDTDPDSNLAMTLAGLRAGGCTVLAVVPVTFHGGSGRRGYVVVAYDPDQDAHRPRATAGDLQNAEMPTDPRTRGRLGNAEPGA